MLFCLFVYGTLCRAEETAIFPAVSSRGVCPKASSKNEMITACFFYHTGHESPSVARSMNG
jgi:hypothetical protein